MGLVLTVLLKRIFISFEFLPGPVEDLIREYGTQEDLCKGSPKGPVSCHLGYHFQH